MDRIAVTFNQLKAERRPGLVLFLTAGFPDQNATLELVPALVEVGADIIELGVPFSDPLADGVTIQASNNLALDQGVTLRDCIDMVKHLRNLVPNTPLLLMGYFNPIFSYGLECFASDAQAVGVDGVIVVDLPGEEAAPLRSELSSRGVHLIPLLAPNSTDERIKQACMNASGFIYCISLTGVTGSREEVPSGAFSLVNRVRQHTAVPVAVGFGISSREHVQAVCREAEAAVVGSALIRTIAESPRDLVLSKARRFVSELCGLN